MAAGRPSKRGHSLSARGPRSLGWIRRNGGGFVPWLIAGFGAALDATLNRAFGGSTPIWFGGRPGPAIETLDVTFGVCVAIGAVVTMFVCWLPVTRFVASKARPSQEGMTLQEELEKVESELFDEIWSTVRNNQRTPRSEAEVERLMIEVNRVREIYYHYSTAKLITYVSTALILLAFVFLWAVTPYVASWPSDANSLAIEATYVSFAFILPMWVAFFLIPTPGMFSWSWDVYRLDGISHAALRTRLDTWAIRAYGWSHR